MELIDTSRQNIREDENDYNRVKDKDNNVAKQMMRQVKRFLLLYRSKSIIERVSRTFSSTPPALDCFLLLVSSFSASSPLTTASDRNVLNL